MMEPITDEVSTAAILAFVRCFTSNRFCIRADCTTPGAESTNDRKA